MKKVFKILGILLLLVIIGVIGMLTYVKTALPNVGDAPDLSVEITPERLERGAYLANHVALCMDCHGKRDWSVFSGPLVDGTGGKGGEAFNQDFGFPGAYYAKNITPAHLGNWTDGEIFRAITTGVSKDGSALFPVMPYPYYGQMDKEDIYSIIAYVRSLPSIENEVPPSSSDFPMNFIINLIPKPAQFTKIPDPSDELAYGKYLYNASGCTECHTQQVQGQPKEELRNAGGFEFILPTGGVVRSSNITQDEKTGIGTWTKEMFVNKFKTYVDTNYVDIKVEQGDYNTVMPWKMYAGMDTTDLEAIYTYLKTVEPIEYKVERFTAAK